MWPDREVHIFSGTTRVDGHLDVPVIGATDHHDIDIFAVQQLPIILEDLRCAAKAGPRLLAHVTINIRNRNDVAVCLSL